jgi:hypothetical protein
MNELTIDENLLNSFPEVVIDGQNIAFAHGREKNGKALFSYDGLGIVAEFLYRRRCKPVIVLPSFWLKERYTSKYDDNKVIERLEAYGIFLSVKTKNSNKVDDLFILNYAFNNNACVLTNDKFRDKLEKLSENENAEEYALWSQWLSLNRIGFSFSGDVFCPIRDSLSFSYTDCQNDDLANSKVLSTKEEKTVPVVEEAKARVLPKVRLGPSPVMTVKINPNAAWSAIWRTD